MPMLRGIPRYMFNKLKTCGVIIAIAFTSFFLISQVSFAQPYACIPTCINDDAKFLIFAAGATLQTINNQNLEVQIRSEENSPTVEIGVFDGDAIQEFIVFEDFTWWDRASNRPTVELLFSLFPDPEGNGQGNGNVVATWSSDGSIGDNMGDPMPDNEWFSRVLPNAPGAQTEDGFYSYRLEVSVLNPDPDPAGEAWNAFKLRTDGIISITAGSAFNYMAARDNFFDLITIYPDYNDSIPECVLPPGQTNELGGFCDPDDPSCCLFNTTYDGNWKFCMIVPEGVNTLDIWDGDLDYGSASADPTPPDFPCNLADGQSVDTDDQNTPIALPPWSVGTDVVTQGISTPTGPPDDLECLATNLRRPSINYNLIGPGGVTYTNTDPSGNLEWELFNISTEPFDPDLYDIQVDNIEGGLWCIEPFGNDIRNLNSLRLPFDMFGLDENGNPVLPTPMPSPMPTPEPIVRDVPTLNVWGMFGFGLITLFVSIYYLKRRRATNTAK